MSEHFRAPKPEVQWPGFRMPDEPSVGELYYLGRKNPCENWAMKDFFSGSHEKVHCSLPVDHEYEYGLPHIDISQSKAWRNGHITDVWFKDKAVGVRSGRKHGTNK